MVQVHGAPAPRRRRRKVREASEGPPGEVPLTRVTVVRASGLGAREEAAEWLEGLADNPEGLADFAEEGLVLVNRALGASRVAAGDPYISEVSLERAAAIRVGYGSGEQLAEGRWTDARELEPGDPRSRRERREEGLRPQERVAAVLGAREGIDTCETLIARARVDWDAGREREAALQLRVGVEALLVELRGAMQDPGHAEDMAVLGERGREVGDAANAALHGELDETTAAQVLELLQISERVLRRRRVLRG
ncbi:MAG: hypothetical protein AABM29_10595 [Actinomycetota bacterium]